MGVGSVEMGNVGVGSVEMGSVGVGRVGVGSVSSGLELKEEERKRTAGLVCNDFLVK